MVSRVGGGAWAGRPSGERWSSCRRAPVLRAWPAGGFPGPSGRPWRRRRSRPGTTLIEVMIGFAILLLILGAAYKLFFSQVRTIRSALEHLTVNESARRFLSQFGNDVRNANLVLDPAPVAREAVAKLAPAPPGVVCRLLCQQFDWRVKPPAPGFIQPLVVTWRLERAANRHLDLWRLAEGIGPDGKPVKSRIKICEGIREMVVYHTARRPVRTSSFAGLPVKNALIYTPYDHDGHGPQLLHARVTFVRASIPPEQDDVAALTLRTAFAVRGRKNHVNP